MGVVNLLLFMQVSKCATHWVVELDQEWVPCSSRKSVRSTLIGWCWHSLCFPPQRFQIQWLSHTMPHFLYISLLRMLMSAWFWITRLYMIFASGLLNWLLPAVSKYEMALVASPITSSSVCILFMLAAVLQVGLV